MKHKMKNPKEILISILIGAVVAFLSTLFEGLAQFMKEHSTELIAGGATSFHYIVRNIKIG